MILITTLNKWAYNLLIHFYFNINNLIVPYSFASTAHFAVTFYLSFTIVLGATLLGLYIHKLKIFSLFVYAGCPLALIPLLVIIVFISYLAIKISLGLRLAVKSLSNHKLLSLNVLAGFTYNISTGGIIFFFADLVRKLWVARELCTTGGRVRGCCTKYEPAQVKLPYFIIRFIINVNTVIV